MKQFTQYRLIFYVALFFIAFDNVAFFNSVTDVYAFTGKNILYVLSLSVFLFGFILLLFSLLASKYTTKPLLIIALIVSSFTSYFMNTFHVIIDDVMIRNALQTNVNESSDLFTLKLALYVIFLGFLPSIIVWNTKVSYRVFGKELLSRIKTIFFAVAIVGIVLFSFSKFYSSFFREHKPLRYSTNPTYWIYSIGKYIDKTYNNGPIILKSIGTDAKIDDKPNKRRLVIMVVGETARADRFSLNGYKRETNPLLKKENIVNFSNMSSCGTSTAVSVPCMFSKFDRSSFSYKRGISYENAVDVLKHTNKVDILWRDNNSDSKGVALRVKSENYRTNATNTICDTECRDVGMIVGLDKYVNDSKKQDIFIVLHHMGNHGPAYYKRYPKEFVKFKPECKSNQLEKCTKEEIDNSYDNALLYTDYFLSKVIDFLKPYNGKFETAMVYMSDHGESLGEKGVYLHGMPYVIAPIEQTHIGSVMYFGKNFPIDKEKLKSYSSNKFSHDNLFDTLLGLFDVKTSLYKKEKDILYNAEQH